MLRIISLLVIVFLAGCNPVKQVLKSQDKTDEVVTEYRKKNPPKNDTTYLPGKVIVRDTTIYDSIPVPFPVNHKYIERHFRDSTIRDTVKIIDRDLMKAVLNRLDSVEVKFTVVSGERDYWQSEAHKRLYILIALIAAVIGSVVYYLLKTFQPKITLGK